MANATEVVPEPERVTDGGLKVQTTEADTQEKVTGPLNPFVAASESVKFPVVCPAATVTELADA
jgi:hypothetical protein